MSGALFPALFGPWQLTLDPVMRCVAFALGMESSIFNSRGKLKILQTGAC